MSDAALTKEIASMLRGLSTQEAKALLKNLRAEAIEEVEAENTRHEGESKMSKKKRQEYFKKFDSQINEKPIIGLRQELLEITGWTPEMGDCELHFKDKPLGGQCLWACKWHTGSRGILYPDTYYPLDRMKSVELLAEGRDLVHMRQNFHGVRHPDIAFVEEEILPIIKTYDAGGTPSLERLRDKIRKCRGSYTEFICPWDIPADSFMVIVRPGWGDRKEIIAAMEKLRSNRVPRR